MNQSLHYKNASCISKMYSTLKIICFGKILKPRKHYYVQRKQNFCSIMIFKKVLVSNLGNCLSIIKIKWVIFTSLLFQEQLSITYIFICVCVCMYNIIKKILRVFYTTSFALQNVFIIVLSVLFKSKTYFENFKQASNFLKLFQKCLSLQ